MKEIISYLVRFKREDLKWIDLIISVLFVAGFTYLYYGTDLITHYQRMNTWKPQIIAFYFVLYLVPYVFGLALQSLTHKDWSYWKDWRFIALMLAAIVIFTSRSSFHLIYTKTYDVYSWTVHQRWAYSVFYSISRMLLIFFLVWIYWKFFEKDKQAFYGFTRKGFNTKPYFIMLAIMVPLIVWASTQDDFLRSYPRGLKFSSLHFDDPSHRIYYILYEITYGLDFFSIEFFFRGFMVMAFVRYIGPRAIIPMALFYMAIHMGKPAGELVSSFFGGTLLGIIAYYSKSIVGGIIVHVGIAYLMELGGYFGHIMKL